MGVHGGKDGSVVVGLRRFDEEDEEDGEEGGGGEDGEDDGEREVEVAHSAEAPVGETTGADADEVHDAVAGGAVFRESDLAEDGHVIGVEEAPAEAEEDEEGDGDPELAGLG